MIMFDSSFVCFIVNSSQRDNKETQGPSRYLMTGIDIAEITLFDATTVTVTTTTQFGRGAFAIL